MVSASRKSISSGDRAEDRKRGAVIEPLFYCSMTGIGILLLLLVSPLIMLGYGLLDQETAGGLLMASSVVAMQIGIIALPAVLILALFALIRGTWRLRLRVVVSTLLLALAGTVLWILDEMFIGVVSDAVSASTAFSVLAFVVVVPMVWLIQLARERSSSHGKQ